MKYIDNTIVYEVGDWVYKLPGFSISYGDNYGGGGYNEAKPVFKIKRVSDSGSLYLKYGAQVVWGEQGNGIYSNAIRLATQSEIDEASKPKFEIGDWTYWKDEWLLSGTHLGKIISDEGGDYRVELPNGKIKLGGKYCCLRLATPDEVSKALKPVVIIGGYTAEYRDGAVHFGCKRYFKEYLKRLSETMEAGNIAAVKVESEMVSHYQIQEILEGFE